MNIRNKLIIIFRVSLGRDMKLVRNHIYYSGVIGLNHVTNFMSCPNETQKMIFISYKTGKLFHF